VLTAFCADIPAASINPNAQLRPILLITLFIVIVSS
jgi:hypothetical protein